MTERGERLRTKAYILTIPARTTMTKTVYAFSASDAIAQERAGEAIDIETETVRTGRVVARRATIGDITVERADFRRRFRIVSDDIDAGRESANGCMGCQRCRMGDHSDCHGCSCPCYYDSEPWHSRCGPDCGPPTYGRTAAPTACP